MTEVKIIGYWQADNHSWGNGKGKIHAIDNEPHEDGEVKTFCGQRPGMPSKPKSCPGKSVYGVKHNCLACQRAIDSRLEWLAGEPERERQRQEYQRRIEEEQRRREYERQLWSQEFKSWYELYRRTERWRKTRSLVIARAEGMCEACRSARAVHAHHMTYEHVGCEFLWELKAVCEPCHDRFHATTHIPWTHGDNCCCEFCAWKRSQRS